MLQLRNINKSYKVGDFEQQALKDASLSFRESEFATILGPSGSGKTTMLNIIGGLDRYDNGDLIINGKSTKGFKDRDWDAYRNNSVGFVFQSYNLIGHLSVLSNVEIGMTLSGVSGAERKERALEVLEKVGLKEHRNKRPNQLSRWANAKGGNSKSTCKQSRHNNGRRAYWCTRFNNICPNNGVN
jgi:putative ABC transport system permease protein